MSTQRSRRPRIGDATGLDRVPMRHGAQEAPGHSRDDRHVTRTDEPRPVWAWIVQNQIGDDRVKGEALAWINEPDCRQVWVRYRDRHGREGFVWLWADAVQPRTEDA